MEKSFKKHMRL